MTVMFAITCMYCGAETNKLNNVAAVDPVEVVMYSGQMFPTYTNREVEVRNTFVFDDVDFGKRYTPKAGTKERTYSRIVVVKDEEADLKEMEPTGRKRPKKFKKMEVETGKIYSVSSSTDNVAFPCRYSVTVDTNGYPQAISFRFRESGFKRSPVIMAQKFGQLIGFAESKFGKYVEGGISARHLKRTEEYTLTRAQFYRDRNTAKWQDTLRTNKVSTAWIDAGPAEFGNTILTAKLFYLYFKDLTVFGCVYYDKYWSEITFTVANPRYALRHGHLEPYMWKKGNYAVIPTNVWLPFTNKLKEQLKKAASK